MNAPDPKDEDTARANRALLVLLALIVFAGLGWLLVSALADNSKAEDCGMQGRRNCVQYPELGR
jgi:hypothetical protein